MTSLTAASPRRPAWRPFALRGLLTLCIAVAVALGLAGLLQQNLPRVLSYAVSVSLGCWLFIDGGRLLAARFARRGTGTPASAEWPGWGWMSLVLALGTVAGFGVGHSAARWLLGDEAGQATDASLRSLAAVLLLSLIPGVVATYYFYSRGRLAASLAQAAQAERLASEQRLQLLASQLEPHMLFNTLANLRALIATDPARAQTMLDRLIAFLRTTLAASRTSQHSLADEFARLDDYLELMRIRMGARLQTRLALPAELAAQRVPTLLLQPLVENAIKHGLEPQVQGGRVEVSAAREGAQLVLRVRDDGAGLASAAAAAGFGLEQVRERLLELYGAAASLELVPDAAGGTLATLRMPL